VRSPEGSFLPFLLPLTKGPLVSIVNPMSLDLNDLLRDWPHEPGQIKVRRILGTDGKEKIQLRIDLGLIQMETTGRPDGERPHGSESLLTHHVGLAQEKETAHEQYLLSPEDVSELQQEGIQYYHRYISLFQLNDFPGVIRDTQRNIDLFNFVNQHGGAEEYAHSLEQFRPYVLMMNTRARASIELEHGDFAAALRQIERGREKIVEIFTGAENPELVDRSPEIAFLDEWVEEIRARQPVTKLEKMQREMEAAIASEAYERAAELRDAIRVQMAKKKEPSAEVRGRRQE
jgi:hypothetical protein